MISKDFCYLTFCMLLKTKWYNENPLFALILDLEIRNMRIDSSGYKKVLSRKRERISTSPKRENERRRKK